MCGERHKVGRARPKSISERFGESQPVALLSNLFKLNASRDYNIRRRQYRCGFWAVFARSAFTKNKL